MKKIHQFRGFQKKIERGFLVGLISLDSAFFLRNPCVDLMAQNREEMTVLSRQLSENCPNNQPKTTALPSTSTTQAQNQCPIECSGEIQELKGQIEIYEKRLLELEIKVREIHSNPNWWIKWVGGQERTEIIGQLKASKFCQSCLPIKLKFSRTF